MLLLPALFILIIAKSWSLFSVNSLLVILAAVYSVKNLLLDDWKTNPVRLSWMDLAPLMVAGVEVLNYLMSTYRPNTLPYVVDAFFLSLFYYLVRFNLRSDKQKLVLFVCITIFAVVLSGASLFNELPTLFGRLKSLGFSDLTDFRYLIRLANRTGSSIVEWATIYLLFLPYPLILFLRNRGGGWKSWLLLGPVLLVLVAIFLSFSRGIYAAVIVFFLVGSILFHGYSLSSWRKILVFDVIVFLCLAIVLLPVIRPVLTTITGFRTSAQVRSFEGRREVWSQSLGMTKDHLLFGVGTNNFAMHYMGHRQQSDESVLVAGAHNLFLQLLIEKGLVGLLAYCLLFFIFFLTSHRKIKLSGAAVYKKGVIILFMTTVAAAIVRDFSYYSILTNAGVSVLLWFMFAHNAQLEGDLEEATDEN